MNFLRNFTLPSVVYLTGACVLILEILATRILSPYFGNTIFTISSVIGIVLSALSFGYYLGGKIADRYPSEVVFYSIILYSGLAMFLLYIIHALILPIVGYKLSLIAGPLIVSATMFFLPSLLLGMLSPFAVKLRSQQLPQKGIGTVAGEIFFWSTLGSIFGSFSAGFILIPNFGIDGIVVTIAVVLSLLGFFPLLKMKAYKKKFFSTTVLMVLLLASISLYADHLIKSASLIYAHDGVYEKIAIYDIQNSGRQIRLLQQGRSSSGAMFIDSEELVFDYTKYYALYKIFQPNVKRALVIGGGAYSIPKALLSDLPDARIDVVEIEPSLFALARKYFRVAKELRLRNYIQDGRRFLHQSNEKYDLIFGDAFYSLFSIPAHLSTEEFFEIVRARLNDEGVFIANLIGKLNAAKPSFILSMMRTFQAVFPNSYFFAVRSPRIGSLQNIIFVGYKSERKLDFNSFTVSENKNMIIRNLAAKSIDTGQYKLKSYSKFTDNYSPVEYFIASSMI